jgi:phosphatidate phosphatase APP1
MQPFGELVMDRWRKRALRGLVDLETRIDLLKYRARERIGGRNPIEIVAYRGYGTANRLYLKGRVQESLGVRPATEQDSILRNALNMYRRLRTNEIPYARVLARFGDLEKELVSDVEGFFDVYFETEHPLPTDRLWHQVTLELIEPRRPGHPPVSAVGEVLVLPPGGSGFGVISDIDDTVVFTDAAHVLGMMRNVLLGSAHTRLPFPGVGAFYRALVHGAPHHVLNPVFYVSNSPWNLYDLLSEFFSLNDIPLGPVLFLRDWGLSVDGILPMRQLAHKSEVIRNIMDFYPDLPFILIGDSGELDPEIYRDIVALYPKRILAVYIRNVSTRADRIQAIHELAAEIAGAGSTLVLAEDTVPMAEHALSKGWIVPEAVAEVRAEVAAQTRRIGHRPPVTIRRPTSEQTRQAVEAGAIEEALAREERERAAGVVLEQPDEDGGRA